MRKVLLVSVLIAATTFGTPSAVATTESCGGRQADFNGDGFSDLAVGVPGEDVFGSNESGNAGAVNVIYGSASRLTATGAQRWDQDTPRIDGASEGADLNPAPGDQFGASVTAGDFDGDGFDDMAVGVPGEIGEGFQGAVNVIYGRATGLSAVGDQFWSLDTPGVVGESSSTTFWGHSVVACDFDGDGFDDLAVGAWAGDVNEENDNFGTVSVIYGTSEGLDSSGSQLWSQNSPGILDIGETLDNFGRSLAAGDINGDGFADLAIGAVGEGVGTASNAGAVNVIYGSAAGLHRTGNQFFHQGSEGILDKPEEEDFFAWSLAIADFDNDGFGDLAAGVPAEETSAFVGNAGAVSVIYGSAAGLTAQGDQLWTQDSTDVTETMDTDDSFGLSLAAGRINADGFADLVIGVPQEGLVTGAGVNSAGAVNVIFGTPAGLRATGEQFWSQDADMVKDSAEEFDRFGSSLAIGDFNGDGRGDLAVGVPGEDVVGADDGSGAVNVLYGSPAALTTNGNQFWTQESIGEVSEPWTAINPYVESFGASVV